MIRIVITANRARKNLGRVPKHIAIKYAFWHGQVEEHGLETVQKIASYHDETLTGKLQGLRSIRLSGAYRAYYRIVREKVECVFVEKVNKHDNKAIERLFGA